MAARVILVTHDEGPRDDRASRFLAERGIEVAWTCPPEGGGLPAPLDGFDAAIVSSAASGSLSRRRRARAVTVRVTPRRR